MTPIRVTFTLRTPMVIPYTDSHFDALLSWSAVQKAEFDGEYDPWLSQHNIGVAKHSVKSAWCFEASLLDFEWIGERNQVHYIKRSKLEDYTDAYMDGVLDRRPAFDGQRGSTKAGSYLVPSRWAKTVTGYAIVNDMARFAELLPWITHIGKLRHKDFGAVAAYEVTEDASATSKWTNRNMPIGSTKATSHAPAIGGLVSPYWKRAQHCEILAFCG